LKRHDGEGGADPVKHHVEPAFFQLGQDDHE
jgi:hypothetical protein